MDYDFTAQMEEDLDMISEGKKKWKNITKHYYKDFHPIVERLMKKDKGDNEMKRELGKDSEGHKMGVMITRSGLELRIVKLVNKKRMAQKNWSLVI